MKNTITAAEKQCKKELKELLEEYPVLVKAIYTDFLKEKKEARI